MSAITLDYALSELPSSQHRAGLAGLVLMLQWLSRQPGKRKGVAALTRLDANGAAVTFDEKGIAELFDHVYAAAMGEVESNALRKSKGKETVEPLRTEEREITDKAGKVKTKTVYIYPQVVPRGAFLLELDPTRQGERGLWVKLWRDTVWTVLRGVPAQRAPYEARAEKTATKDAAEAWKSLRKPDASDELPSTYFIGAQACNAENVQFRDVNRFLFLLHFWPFVASIYVPQVIGNDGKSSFEGRALAIPDIADLELFCEEYDEIMRERPVEVAAYLPRGALVDVVEEVGLDLIRQLRGQLAKKAAKGRFVDIVFGVDVVHLSKDGNNVRLLASTRVEPGSLVDEYERVKGAFWDARFRQTRLRALVRGERWFSGFDRLFGTTDYELTFARPHFRRDAREAFRMEAEMTESSDDVHNTGAPASTEEIIYRVVGGYLIRKLNTKHQLTWEKAKDNPSLRADFERYKERLAKDAFLAVRSRTGPDFIEYFTGTLCSVPQHIGEAGFLALTRALMTETDTVRTLTLLALSARA
ncbi:MAG: type I-MYXAN CRISPR-associated protein Cmx8 [Deltaproteobacteria bacterium]|nr:type I-MYXAN CRISPR-associated protein Cmx8 [Deltaproteobacteria bacterium]